MILHAFSMRSHAEAAFRDAKRKGEEVREVSQSVRFGRDWHFFRHIGNLEQARAFSGLRISELVLDEDFPIPPKCREYLEPLVRIG